MSTWVKDRLSKMYNSMIDDHKYDDTFGFKVPKFYKQDFEETKLAACIINPTEDGESTLTMNIKACETLSCHFENIVSFVGKPGVGKSTLASTIYNVLRGDKEEYFATSNCLSSFTEGLWALNENTKVLKSHKDTIDVLDIEGVNDEDVVHYLVVSAMALSKAIILCSNYNGSPRFSFELFKTLQTGAQLFDTYNIRVPKPIIYVQIPFGINEFSVKQKRKKLAVDKKGLIQHIKDTYPNMKPFEIRTFELPIFKNGNRFDENYVSYVKKLICELNNIDQKIVVKKRMQYAMSVVDALNNNSPSMIADINFKLFQNEVDKKISHAKVAAIESIKKQFHKIKISKKLTYDEFLALKFNDKQYPIIDDLLQLVKSIPYYDSTNAKHKQILENLKLNCNGIDVTPYCKLEWKRALDELRIRNINKGDKLIKTYTDPFMVFVKHQISNKISQIDFYGSTHMSYDLSVKIEEKKAKYKRELIKETQDDFEIPKDFLNVNLEGQWETEISLLKTQWNTAVSRALNNPKPLHVSGNLTCSKCDTKHSSGVSHLDCPSKSQPSWYWVNAKTHHFVCEGCKDVRTISYSCCSKCSTRLDADIIQIH